VHHLSIDLDLYFLILISTKVIPPFLEYASSANLLFLLNKSARNEYQDSDPQAPLMPLLR